jgi:aminoglycoside phosphotransferase (APT) family kinase protein
MKKPKITDESAVEILRHHFGKTAKYVKRIHGGLVNHVFEARIGREELVLRISQRPEKLQVFMKEQWAVTEARKHKVPTPEILEVCNDILGLPYMVSRQIRGRSAGSIGLKKIEVLRELGKHTAIINSIKTHDYGHIFDWSPNKLSRHRTWPEFLDNELDVEGRLESFSRLKIFEPARIKKLRHQVRVMRQWEDCPSLTHGDIRLKNVMLDDKRKIIALLDWEDCMSTIPPYWELSIALHDLNIDEKQAFLEGYGLSFAAYRERAPAIKAFNILNYIRTVHHAAHDHNEPRLAQLRARLNGAFDLYSL